MAIAEAEPKKSEVAVTSAGVSDGMKEKALNAGKKFVDNKGSASTSVGTVKRYNLYDSIKGFRFEMPDGWNDEDIALFVACCWEKKDDFVKTSGDRTRIWADIAQSGAKQSRNPSLFTINSCLALAERIRYYVSKNSSIFLDNEAFMEFHSDVKGLLPHFSDNFETNTVMESKYVRRKVKSKPMDDEYASELLNNDSGLGDVIHELAQQYAGAIRNGNENVWAEMSDKLEEHLGLNTDVKTILESEKNKIISSVARMEEKGMDKKTAFNECARGFIEVFDFINPKNIKVSNYLPSSVGSTVYSVIQGKDKATSKAKRPNYNRLAENSSVNKNMPSHSNEEDNDDEDGKRVKRSRIPKGRRLRTKTVESKLDSEIEDVTDSQEVSVEPSSTTSFDELADGQYSSAGGKEKRKDSTSNEDFEEGSPNKNTTKNSRRRNEVQISPRRIMPPRVARNKVVSYSLNKRKVTEADEISNSSKSTASATKSSGKSNQQRSFSKDDSEVVEASHNLRDFDTDNEEPTVDLTDRFRRTKTNIANPDTTTKDPDEKITSNAPFVKKLNRKRMVEKKRDVSSKQEQSGSKVRILNPDCAMKSLVVKLVDCNGVIDNPTLGNIMKQDKSHPFSNRMRSDRSKEVKLIEESATLAKDVVDSEYNPSSDSAKLVSDEHLNNGHFSGLRNEAKKTAEPARMPVSGTSFKDSNLFPTKHHISPFFEFSKRLSDGMSVSADSSADVGSIGPVVMTTFCNKTLQDNSVSSPYSANAGSSSIDGNQTPSTSSANVNSTTTDKVEQSLESVLATLKKCQNELMSSQDSGLCVTTSEVIENNQVFRTQDTPLPDWFGSFVSDFRRHEAWKIQQLYKMQREITDVEHRKVLILEKILGNLIKE